VRVKKKPSLRKRCSINPKVPVIYGPGRTKDDFLSIMVVPSFVAHSKAGKAGSPSSPFCKKWETVRNQEY